MGMLAPVQAMRFGRTFNRAQQVAYDMKDDLTSYEYRPEHIIRIHPGTQYPDNDNRYNEQEVRNKKRTLE
jgi:hypothetical protein